MHFPGAVVYSDRITALEAVKNTPPEREDDNPNWGAYDTATKAALAIVQDCNDRRGLRL